MKSLLDIKNLSVDFVTDKGLIHAVDKVSFSIRKGETLGLVGESGSGKSVTSLAVMRLLAQPPGRISHGEILLEGQDLLKISEQDMRAIRGNRISMIFQEPMTSLNPVFTVGYQIVESVQLHQKLSKNEAWQKATELLNQVGIPNASQRVKSFPHELSGGQRQRVMIAMAIACEPDLLIADEPTTALDVTVQKQILSLLTKLQEKYGMSLLFITHDLGVIKEISEDVVVMYKGRAVEEGSVHNLFSHAKHPYTKGLLACRPSLEKSYKRLATVSDFMDQNEKEKSFDLSELGVQTLKPSDSTTEPIVEVRGLKKHFPLRSDWFGNVKEWVHAVDGVDLKIQKGHTLGLVGESGCGKTTLGRTLLRLIEPTEGTVLYEGQKINDLSHKEMRHMRRKMQIIFQDPYASLNPRMSVGDAIMEPMAVHKIETTQKARQQKAVYLMEKVGLSADLLKRYPHEFSGGQRQRICIARALAVEPDFIVCDESVSSLDVSVQARILNLLIDLQDEMGLTYVFISHDLAVVKFISDELAVMNQGQIVEYASSEDIYKNPKSEYTKKLLSSIPGSPFHHA